MTGASEHRASDTFSEDSGRDTGESGGYGADSGSESDSYQRSDNS